MNDFDKILKSYDYKFPAELIAQAPASPRDSAKLLVYDRTSKTTQHDIYKNLVKYLPKNGVLVLNQTKVLPARIEITKASGGKARLLYINQDNNLIKFLSDRKLEIDSEVKMPVLQNTKTNINITNKLAFKPKIAPMLLNILVCRMLSV